MSFGRILPTLFVAALLTVVVAPTVIVLADGSGSAGSATVPADAAMPAPDSAVATGSAALAPAPSSTPSEALPTEGDVVKDVARAISTKDWWLLAGALLAALIYATRYTLAKKWPKWGESHYGVLIAAGMAGVTGLAVAWLADGEVASSHTFIGALKLLAAATVAYVLPKKVAQGIINTGTASSSDVPAP